MVPFGRDITQENITAMNTMTVDQNITDDVDTNQEEQIIQESPKSTPVDHDNLSTLSETGNIDNAITNCDEMETCNNSVISLSQQSPTNTEYHLNENNNDASFSNDLAEESIMVPLRRSRRKSLDSKRKEKSTPARYQHLKQVKVNVQMETIATISFPTDASKSTSSPSKVHFSASPPKLPTRRSRRLSLEPPISFDDEQPLVKKRKKKKSRKQKRLTLDPNRIIPVLPIVPPEDSILNLPVYSGETPHKKRKHNRNVLFRAPRAAFYNIHAGSGEFEVMDQDTAKSLFSISPNHNQKGSFDFLYSKQDDSEASNSTASSEESTYEHFSAAMEDAEYQDVQVEHEKSKEEEEFRKEEDSSEAQESSCRNELLKALPLSPQKNIDDKGKVSFKQQEESSSMLKQSFFSNLDDDNQTNEQKLYENKDLPKSSGNLQSSISFRREMTCEGMLKQ